MAEKEKEQNQVVKDVIDQKYEYGFTTDVHTEIIEKGLNEDVVRLISQKKGEPEWMLEFRLKAYHYWKTLREPKWGHVHVPPVNYQEISYYADPLAKKPKNKEIDPELEKTFDKLGIPLEERLALSGTAVDAIMDSVSVKTTFKEKLREKGVIFCSIGEAIKEHPDLVKEYLGTVVPYRDNFYAALNSCVFSDGSFVYIPKGVRCPMELSSYFRINARNTGQFERTLIIADDDVDNHRAARLHDVETGTERRRERLLDELRVARTGLLSRFLHRALLDHRAARRDADHNARAEDETAADDLLDEVAQHALRDVVVRDDALAQWADGDDVARRAADHLLGLITDSQDVSRITLYGDNRRLAQDNPPAFHMDERIGRAEVNTHIVR